MRDKAQLARDVVFAATRDTEALRKVMIDVVKQVTIEFGRLSAECRKQPRKTAQWKQEQHGRRGKR